MGGLKFLFLGIWVLLTACSDRLVLQSSRWSREGPAPTRPRGLDAEAPPLLAGSRKLIFQTQVIDGVEIEDSYYKEIQDSEPEFIAYNWAQEFPSSLKAKILLMKRNSPRILAAFLKENPSMSSKDFHPVPQLVIQKGEPRWKLTMQTKEGRLLGIYLDSSLKIQKSQYLGSSLESAAATLFPEGPILSQLQKVWITNLSDSRNLVSPKIRVMTQSNQVAVAEDAQFIFPIEDHRFGQVQVFFYISKALEWSEKNLKFTLPFVLEAETSVGFPDKTNAAFYYQRRIRFGDGDDVTFSHIPLDPSIVFHESFHSIIDSVARLPFEGEGGSLNEGFADFFTAALTNNPNLGDASYKKAPYKRTVKNSIVFYEKNGGLYHDSGIVSGLLWSLRDALGFEEGTQLAWLTLLRLTPGSNFASFHQELLEEIKKLSIDQQGKARAVLRKRGWAE